MKLAYFISGLRCEVFQKINNYREDKIEISSMNVAYGSLGCVL